MKRVVYPLIVLPLLILPLLMTAQTFTITGQVLGLPENSQVTLSNLNNPGDTVARSLVKSGKFVLSGKVDEPNLFQLNFDGEKKKTVLFMGNEQISLKGNIEQIQQFEITGSTVHQDFIEFQQTFNPLFQRLGELNQRIGMQQNLQRGDSIVLEYQAQLDKINEAIDRFVLAKKASPLGPFLLLVTSELFQDVTAMEKRFNLLDPTQQNSFYGKMLRRTIDDGKIGAIGTQAIDFTQTDTSGKQVSLSSFRGKYVLVDFWASWCKPCRMENPNVVAAYHKFKEKKFTVLGVSLDRAREPWVEAIKTDGLTWTHVSDLKFWNNEVARIYKIDQIPLNILVGPDGMIIAKNLRGQELQSKLCELLGCD